VATILAESVASLQEKYVTVLTAVEKRSEQTSAMNDGDGYVWYDFETDMERISEKFNRQYPEDAIIVYVKTEDGFENLYEFQDGGLNSDEEIIHYQAELQKVCEGLNQMASKAPLQLYEIYSQDNHTYEITATVAYPSRNYNHLPNRIKALTM
jgi:hypothetical protein